MYIYIYIIYQHLNTVCSKREKWLDSIHQKDLPKRHQTPVSWDPEAMGFDLDLEVLPSAMDVWAIEEKALIAADGPMVRHQLMME